MNEPCDECRYAREERAGIHMVQGGLNQAQADELAKGELCAKHRGPRPLTITVIKYDRTNETTGEYVGWPRTLAGPFRMGFNGSREEVVEKYRRWLFAEVKAKTRAYHKLTEIAQVARTEAGLTLNCMEPDIGEVIKRCLEWMETQRKDAK